MKTPAIGAIDVGFGLIRDTACTRVIRLEVEACHLVLASPTESHGPSIYVVGTSWLRVGHRDYRLHPASPPQPAAATDEITVRIRTHTLEEILKHLRSWGFRLVAYQHVPGYETVLRAAGAGGVE